VGKRKIGVQRIVLRKIRAKKKKKIRAEEAANSLL